MSEYVEQTGYTRDFTGDGSWAILSPIEQQIKDKIERVGTPLKNWNIRINYGIKTGYNEAFIIDGTKRDELIAQDPKSAEIIRPILRGRDIKKYGYQDSGLWLIYVPWHFPLHTDSSISGPSLLAENEFEKQYPAVYTHLLSYKIPLSLRNKAETGIRYEWYVLQRWGANYCEDFFKQKIMYPNMTKYLPFYLDNKGFMQNDKSFMIVGENLAYLTAYFNSSLFKFCFMDSFPELLGGTRELRKIFFDKIPAKTIDDNTDIIFQKLVDTIQLRKSEGLNTRDLEEKIDQMLFDIYELTTDEKNAIGFIEIK